MATYAARRLADMADNSAGIVAIELLAAAQGVDLRRPLKTSPRLQQGLELVRRKVRFRKDDRAMAPDIAAAKALVTSGEVRRLLAAPVLTS
jgi:histidine ammonia-lyase